MRRVAKLRTKIQDSGAGFRYKHALGQNFIYDEELLEKLAAMSGAGPEEDVIEIGAGSGMLTKHLAGHAHHVYALELDKSLKPYLMARLLGQNNVSLRFDDALRVDFSKWIKEEGGGGSPLRVAANLPYYITSEILTKLYRTIPELTGIAVMLQAEAADKLTAAAGEEGCNPLGIALAWRYELTKTLDVPAACFEPQPRVDSRFLALERRKETPCPVSDEALLLRVIRGGFAMRRKTMANNLASLFGVLKEKCNGWLTEAELPENVRAEQMDIRAFCRLTDVIADDIGNFRCVKEVPNT